MGLFSRSKPKIKIQSSKKESFSGWVKCSGCSEMIHLKELQQNLKCCPKCGWHYPISAEERIGLVCDKDSFQEKFSELTAQDPLEFTDSEPYTERLKRAKEKSSNKEAVIVGEAAVNKQKIALAVMDFSFMGGSMGSVVGEKITLLIEYAIEKRLPLVIVTASGGARMQESVFSLMQMAKTSAALTRLAEKKLPYIAVLTNPTTGGVTASFAALGDIIIAEPNALIAFAGPRVVEQTIKEKLPEGAQKSEFLLEKGMIDAVVKRSELKEKIFFFTTFLMNSKTKQEKLSNKLKEMIEAGNAR